MIRSDVTFFAVVGVLCVLIIVSITIIVLNTANKPGVQSDSYTTLTLDEAIRVLEKRFGEVFDCVERKSCDLYGINVVIIATPAQGDLYDVTIWTEGLNYTCGDSYRDTVVWRVTLGRLSYHISMMSYGVLEGYEEWLGVEKRLGIRLDVGRGVCDRSGGRLWVYVDLPTFDHCNHACGQFYLNTTLYIDREKYVVYQYMELDFSYLIDKGYIKIREVENNYAYPINPPAILYFTYIRSPFWRIPLELLNSTKRPLIVSLHIATTNRTLLEEYLRRLEVISPLVEAYLLKQNSEAARRFLEYLRSRVVEKLYPGAQMEIMYVSNPRGGDYYSAKWDGAELQIDLGTLDVYMRGVTREFVEALINPVLDLIRSAVSSPTHQ